MSLVSGKLNQTVGHRRFVRTDAYGQAEFDELTELQCRLEDARTLIRDATGKEVISESVLYCERDVKPQDVIVINDRDVRILHVSRKVGLDGAFDHCEVRL